MNIADNKAELLPIVIAGYTFKPNADGFRVTSKGLTWLEEKSPEINEACRLRNADKAKKRGAI